MVSEKRKREKNKEMKKVERGTERETSKNGQERGMDIKRRVDIRVGESKIRG